MLQGEKLEHLGELAAKEQASRARDILRFVLKILCFNHDYLYFIYCLYGSFKMILYFVINVIYMKLILPYFSELWVLPMA